MIRQYFQTVKQKGLIQNISNTKTDFEGGKNEMRSPIIIH